jgi:hypothetical protein
VCRIKQTSWISPRRHYRLQGKQGALVVVPPAAALRRLIPGKLFDCCKVSAKIPENFGNIEQFAPF